MCTRVGDVGKAGGIPAVDYGVGMVGKGVINYDIGIFFERSFSCF